MSVKTFGSLALWAVLTWTFSLGIIDAALLFSILLLTPLLLEMVVVGSGTERSSYFLKKLLKCYWFFAIFGILSIILSDGLLSGIVASGWMLFTVFVSLCGFLRFIERGTKDWEEILIHFGLLYFAVGGGWLVLSRMGAEAFLPYSAVIIDLTAIHFHYAAFCVLLLAGVFGRWIKLHNSKASNRFFYLASGLIAGPFLVAIGLDAGPPLEPVLVGIYVVFLFWLSIEWFLASLKMTGWQKVGVMLSALILPITMMLSLLYSIGLMVESSILLINEMLKWHGAINAFIFSFFATVTWHSFKLNEQNPPLDFPISKVRGKGRVTRKEEWFQEDELQGLISTWDVYKRDDFDPNRLSLAVKNFYMQTNLFKMNATLKWHGIFNGLTIFTRTLTKRIGQLNLPVSSSFAMTGSLKKVTL